MVNSPGVEDESAKASLCTRRPRSRFSMAAYSLSGKMRNNGDKDCEEGGLFSQSGREQWPQSSASNNISSLTDHRKIPFTKLA